MGERAFSFPAENLPAFPTLSGIWRPDLWDGARQIQPGGGMGASCAMEPDTNSAEAAWRARAHVAQLPPDGAWATWLFIGGRGAGKTRAGAEWIAGLASLHPDGRFALIAPTEHDLREVMIEGASGLLNLPDRETPKYESSRRLLKWSNGAKAYGFSAEKPERLRGPQFDAAWGDELVVWNRAGALLSTLRLGLRRGAAPRLLITTTPKQSATLEQLKREPGCVITQAGTMENAANLSPDFMARADALFGGTDFYAQEIEGKVIDNPGAMWRPDDFEALRKSLPDTPRRVIVAVDPPAGGAVGREGSACGIVVACLAEGNVYVMADRSRHGLTPRDWANHVAKVAREFGASMIAAECNQGGDMVGTMLKESRPPCPVKLVRAKASKRARAQPVFQFYQNGRVWHAGPYPELEAQLVALGQGEGGDFDRADALVWAVIELLVEGVPVSPAIVSLT